MLLQYFLSFTLSFLFLSAPLNAQQSIVSKFERLDPVLLGTDGIASIHVDHNSLYVASYSNGLYIFDISDPFYPKIKGRTVELNIPTSGIGKKDNVLYQTDNVGGILVFDISNLDQISLLKKLRTKSAEAWDLKIDPSNKYMYVSAGKAGVEIWDITSPSNPKFVKALDDTLSWDFAWGLSINNKKLYVSDKSNGVKIYDISKPRSPKKVGSYKTYFQNHYALSKDSLLFLANGPGGFEVVNLNAQPRPKAIYKQSYKAQFVTGLAFYGKNEDYIFVGTGRSGVYVYHIPSFLKNPQNNLNSNPLVNKDQRMQEFSRITQSGHTFYMASNRGVHIYNFDLAPVFTKAESQSVDEQQNLSYTFEGYDPDGSPTRIDLIPIDPKPSTLTYTKKTREVTWKPSYEESGIYTFIARITEDSPDNLFTEHDFSITANHVNRSPSLPQPQNQLVEENKLLEYILPEGTDPDKEDKEKLMYVADSLPDGAQFDAPNRKLSWTPRFDQSGNYTVIVRVEDSNSDGKGQLSDEKTLGIRVDNINRAPSFDRINTLIFAENKLKSYPINASDPDKEDAGKLTYSAVQLPTGAGFDPATQTFSWTPTFEQAGSFTARFKVRDQGLNSLLFPNPGLILEDTMTVNIVVNQTNRKPQFVQTPSQSVKENDKLEFSVIATDPDKEDKGKLVYKALSLPLGATFVPNTLTFTWNPTFDQSGKYDVMFVSTDTGIDGIALTDSLRVVIDVVNVNRKPTIDQVADLSGKENAPLSLPITVFDPDKEDKGKLVVTAVGLPKGAVLKDQNMTWTPGFEQAGEYSITYIVTDVEGMRDSTTHTITVDNTNRSPKFVAVQSKTVNENAPLKFSIQAKDPDSQDQGRLAYKATSLPTGAVFDTSSQTFSWTPTFAQSGTYSVTFQVSDIGIDGKVLSDFLSIPLTVKNVNRKPEIVPVSDTSIAENSLISFIVNVSDPDVEDDGKLRVSCDNLPSGATLNRQAFSWKPTHEQSGSYNLTFTVRDLEGLSASFTHTISVSNTNRGPSIINLRPIITDENDRVEFKLDITDPDKEDKGMLKTVVEGLPEGATFTNNTLNWTPRFDQSGTYQLTYTVTDKDGLMATGSQTIVVKHVNRDPKITTTAEKENRVEVGSPVSFNVSVSDEDAEDQGRLTLVCTSNLPSGASFDSNSGEFNWTPTAEQSGRYSFEFKVTDSANQSEYIDVDLRVLEPAASPSN